MLDTIHTSIPTDDSIHTVTMLTTIDNPFDPFNEWALWLRYDEEHQYFTNAYLARIVDATNDMTDEELKIAQALAIKEIMDLNVLGIYKTISVERVDEFVVDQS